MMAVTLKSLGMPRAGRPPGPPARPPPRRVASFSISSMYFTALRMTTRVEGGRELTSNGDGTWRGKWLRSPLHVKIKSNSADCDDAASGGTPVYVTQRTRGGWGGRGTPTSVLAVQSTRRWHSLVYHDSTACVR